MTYPLVSIVILSWNRRDDVRVSLDHVFETSYPSIEVIVVDNHSTDGTVEMVKTDYPEVIVLSLPENIGITGWNKGFEIAKGEYILVLDDDSYPEKNALSIGITRMVQEPQCGILAMLVYNQHLNFVQTSSLIQGNNTTFIGCGAILRTGILKSVGMFEPVLFLYMHEDEFAMRAINAGFTVLYEPGAIVQHISSPAHRHIDADSGVDVRRQYYLVKNILMILVMHFPFSRLIFRIPRIIIGRFVFGLKYHCVAPILKGIASSVWNIRSISKKRLVLNERTQKLYNYGSFAGGFFFSDGVCGISKPHWLQARVSQKHL
jgi:GT2 family glycosyltransferase